MAMASSRNLLEVIDYVLDVSEIEANDDAREQLFDPETLLSEVISVIQAKAIEKGIYLESSVDSSVRRNFVGDYKHLHQSLLNLSINAINFTHHGHVKLEAKSPISEDFSLRLEVSDTGVGIEKDQMAQIFEPFQSTRAVASNPGGRGTGLGLDIVRRSVESMQGAIGVESESGKGSLFWIELPLKESEQALPQSDQEPDVTGSPADIAPQLSGRVMLVDDNETNLMLGAMLLENAGLEVTPVSSGIEAIRLADPSRVDIILMDISMPNIDGYEATRRIRERYNDMPIIALSAYASSVEKTKAYASGMNDYLVKPINLPEVVRVLSGYLNGSSQLSLEPDSPTSESMPECLLDREAIGVLLSQVGEENYKLVMKKFQHEARQRWSQLEAAQDFDSAAREAHTLASTCASFGLPGISKAFKEIEDKANRGLPSYADGFGSIGLLLEQGLEELANFAA
jgi:CheY-like chemotaxis protein